MPAGTRFALGGPDAIPDARRSPTLTFPPLRLREAWNLGGLTPRQLAVRTWRMVNDHEIMTRAAGVAFYAMLAFVPLLGLILTVVVQMLPT